MIWMAPVAVAQLGWTLIHFLWQGVALAGVLALLFWLTKGRSPRLRHGLACLVLAVMAVAPALTWFQLGRAQVARHSTVAPAVATTTDSPAALSAKPASSAGEVAAVNPPWERVLPWGVGLWFLGVATMSLRLAGGWVWLQWLRRRPATVPASDDIQLRLLRLCQRMNLASNIRILLCEKVPGPTVMGWLRPVILLPPAALLGMPPEQLELVLAHELAHILRHDYAINLLQSCVEVLLFYHPAVWWVSAKIRQERELCCDDLAVRTTGDALDYAAALTRLEALCRPPDPPRHAAQALALGATGGSFMHRIRRLVSPMAPTPLAPRAGLVLALLLGGVFTLHARAGAQDPPPFKKQLPKGAIHVRRYDRDTADGKRRAGSIDLKSHDVTAAELDKALTSMEQMPKDVTKGSVELQLQVEPVAGGRFYAYEFKGCDPMRVRRIIQARDAFAYLGESDKKPGHIVIQRLSRFTYELGLLPQGLHVQVWAGDVPTESVLEALNELMAMAPEAGIPQEVRRQLLPGSGKGKRISLDLVDKDPLQLWKELDAAVRNEPH